VKRNSGGVEASLPENDCRMDSHSRSEWQLRVNGLRPTQIPRSIWELVFIIPRCHPERSGYFAVSEASTESKDHLPAYSEANLEGHSHYAASAPDKNSLTCRHPSRENGILRLRSAFALDAQRPMLAQDDNAMDYIKAKMA